MLNTPRLTLLATIASLAAAAPLAAQSEPSKATDRPADLPIAPIPVDNTPKKGGAPTPPPSIAAPQQAPGAAPAAPVDSRQPIKFEPALLDLGEMQADVAKTGKITIKNVIDKPIKVTKIVPGCGCTTTGAPPGEIPPGGTADVDITLKPGSKAGVPLTKMVTFQIEGFAPQMLTVKGDVKAYIKLSSDMIDGPTSPDAPPMTVVLTAVDNVPFKVTGALPDVLVALPSESKLSHEVQVDWKKWEATGSSVKISLMTDNPKAPQLSLIVKRAIKPGTTPPPPSKATEAAPAIVLAARSGDLAALKAAIAAGGGTESQERMSQRTALHFAAEGGNMEVLRALLDAKANPNAQDRTGKTPVTVAAERGKTDALKALLAAGGDANARDQVQGSPLLWASGLGGPETVALLLGAGANPNIQDVNGMTPLMWAAGVGKPETVTMLLDKGADPKVVDRLTGESALMRAVRTGKTETVRILLAKKPEIEAKNTLGMTAFLIACAYAQDQEKIKMLLDAGADKAAKDQRGWGAIDHARNRVDAKRDEIVKYLEPMVPASTASAPPQTAAPKGQ
jgi:ankyrin repeat protein